MPPPDRAVHSAEVSGLSAAAINGQAGGSAGIAAVRRIYDLLVTEEVDAALRALAPEFEWVEPDLPGHPLAGVHRGAEGIEAGVVAPLRELCTDLTAEPDELIDGGDHVVVTGTVRGRWKDNEVEWRAPFAHVWELNGDAPVRVRAYGDTGGLGVAAARRELSEVAEVLAEQASAIRRQWAELGEAGTPIEWDADDAPPEPVATLPAGTVASARLVAVDMAQEGSSREEVERFLEDELGPDEASTVADQIFPSVVVADPVEEHEPTGPRWTRRFPRHRS